MDTTLQPYKPPRARGPRLLLIAMLAVALALQLAPPQAALAAGNDSLASATLITPPLTNDTTNTTTATRDPGEIGGGGGTCNFPLSGNTHSVWYKYTPASNGFFTVDTFTSNYDTVLEVFSGPATPTFATLIGVACNDDSGATSQSALTFPATSGTHYYIVVRSFGATAGGTLKFSAAFSTQHNLYVNQTVGNDANPGTAARPVKTIQKGVNLAFPSGSIINIVTPGTYAEAVTIAKNLTLRPTAGAVAANSFTLASGAVVALLGNPISAPVVTVQSGARIPDGVALASVGGTVSVGNGTFPQNVTVAKNLTLRAVNEGSATIQPPTGNAVTISAGTVTLRGFTISAGAGTGVNVTGGTGHIILRNNITGNTSGVVNATAGAVNGAQNFWGTANGPMHPSNPGGTGNSVSNNVTYRPWCTTAVPTCNPQAGVATRLVFNPSPSDSTGGVPFPTQPVVEAQDNFGNIDTSYVGNVMLAIATNPGGGTLAGTVTVAVVNGKATFSGLSINKVGVGYTLSATSGSLIAGTSAPFDITAGPATTLAFNPSPSNSTAGAAFPTQPVVEVRDAGGNLATSYIGNITLTIGTNPGGGTLAGTVTLPVSGGQASFSGLSIDKSGVGYTLQASSGALPQATSAAFNIDAGPPTQLVFNPSPSNSTGGVPFPTQPVVEVQDASGNVVISYSGSVTLAIGTNPGGGTLAGTSTVAVVNGKATFSGLSIDKAGTGYTLNATSGSLTGASAAFNITVGPAAKLFFSTSPSNSTATVAFPTQPMVEVQDAGGNLVTTYVGSVTLAIGTNPGGGTLAGTLTVPVSGGQASFSGLSIDKVGTGYTLQATGGSLTAATSNPFNITVGAATKLFFNPSPSNSQAGVAFPTQPVVEVQDAGGNLVVGYSGSVALAIGTNPGGGTLGGTTILAISGGKATFSGLSIDNIGAGYTLQATSAPLTPATSNAFNITKANATVTLSNLNYTYDGSPHSATATTSPPGLTVVLTYTGTTYGPTQTPPTNAGSYQVDAVVQDANYQGSATATLTINKATATVTLSNLNYTYNGSPHGATATTSPPGLPVVLTYTGVAYGPTTTPPTNAGSYQVDATINHQNYQGSATATLTINKAAATITLSSLNHTYDGNPHPAVATTSPINLPVNLTYNGSPRPPANAGSYAVVATIADPNYQGSATATLVIAQASQTITFAALANKAYGDPPFTISASASSGLAVSFSATGQCTVAGSTVTLTGAGSCTITASQAGDTNYTAAQPVQRTFTISKGNQTIDFAALQDRALTNSPFTIGASASSGLAVSFSATGQCSVTGSSVTLIALGNCTITATQAGNANYNPAQPISRTFAIVNSFKIFLPLVMDAPQPDLVGSFTLSPNSVAPNSPVTITVTITNAGGVAASQFWVDFYINPSTPPTDTNQPWNKFCQLNPCYGIAWYITDTIQPGESITLTSTPGSYFAANTRWRGQFLKGTSDLYLYVDSWNPGVATGAVPESNEANNRAEYHANPASVAAEPSPGVLPRPDNLPPRPVRP
jgi:MBG domain/CARDB